MTDLTFAQKKALRYFSGGDTPNRKDEAGNLLRGPRSVPTRNLLDMGLIEIIPDAPRKSYRITEAGTAALSVKDGSAAS